MPAIHVWQMHESSRPMVAAAINVADPAENEALVRVSGCGVCHTDLGFFYEGIRTVKSPPLVLGHEISGIVEAAGSQNRDLVGRAVIVPAVMPCGECDLCRKGRGTICRQQRMPGNHIDGGFASHVLVPARYLCPIDVDDEQARFGESGVTLKEMSVIADAVTTPYQAIKNAGLAAGDVAIFIGCGGIGGFGVQLAAALGSTVIAMDVDARRLEKLKEFGASATFNPREMEKKELRKAIQAFVREQNLSPFEWKIFETSGTAAGQELAFSLLTFGATLSVVGFTMETLQLRLSNLMAYDARAVGNWGCMPEYYPEVVDLVRQGKIQLAPFVQTFPMREINTVFERVRKHELDKRPVLVPDFD